jgi:RNA 2',3'-cyclic 3'-phosphodiesterase
VTRAFLAIRPPDDVLDALAARIDGVSLPEGGRWTPREQWHITVQFFGDVDIDDMTYVLSQLELTGGDARLSGAGTLPRERRSKYLVLFVHPDEWLVRVADAVAERVAGLGLERDFRDYDPHLTLARFKQRVDLKVPCAAIGPEPIEPRWQVSDLVLYESQLGGGPARHIERVRFPLGP